MSKKPSQDPVSRGLAVSTAGTACVRANGGDAPIPQRRETLGEEGSSETLPIKEGWGSKLLWTLENDPLLRKAIECGLTDFIGLSWWVLAVLATAFR
jgi:hypothetical protein